MAEAVGRLISLIFRLSSPVSAMDRARKVAAELVGIGGARSMGFGENRVRSLPDAVAKVIDRHFGFFAKHRLENAVPADATVHADSKPMTNGHSNGQAAVVSGPSVEAAEQPMTIPAQQMLLTERKMVTVDLCPGCGEASLVFEEGCKKCYSCGYSEC
jgi:ribonucleoside-diphosphate reductase alpha chain